MLVAEVMSINIGVLGGIPLKERIAGIIVQVIGGVLGLLSVVMAYTLLPLPWSIGCSFILLLVAGLVLVILRLIRFFTEGGTNDPRGNTRKTFRPQDFGLR